MKHGSRHVRRAGISVIVLMLSTASALAQLVTRVVDGDTIHVAGTGSVRLIGVDTPEAVDPRKPVEFFARESSEFTRRMVMGKVVRLEFDFQRKDKYDRTLAYVYLPDGTFVNAEMIKQGYSHAYTQYPFKYLDQFRTYERDARENGRGLWGAQSPVSLLAQPPTAVDGDQTVYVTRSGTKYHVAGCRSLARSQIPIALKNVGRHGPCSLCNPPVLGQAATAAAAPRPTVETPRAPPKAAPATSRRCQATTKAGKQCARQAQSGRSYCWQH
jgi:endonuclease YncB( thermonuclease family)